MQTIGGIQRSTLVDFPGKVACSVFFNGCNFRCGFCHNPFLLFNYKENVSVESFFEFLGRRVGLLDGVVLSGGEPCMDSDIVGFAKKVKEMGFLLKLDTNGSFPDVLEELLPILDYVAMDIKGSKERYSKVCGVDVDISKIEKSVSLIQESGVKCEFRTTVVPGVFDLSEVTAIGKWVGGGKWVVQNFVGRDSHVGKEFVGKVGFSEEELEKFVVEGEKWFDEVVLR